MKADNKDLEKIRQYFRNNHNLNLTDEELLECKQSLYHLGKAIYLFHQLKKGGQHDK